MRTKVTVVALVAALVVYLAIVGYRGVLLIGSGEVVGIILGIAVLVLPVIGAWLVWRELQFGAATERLAAELQALGRWPTEVLPTRPSGRPRRDAADEVFQVRRVDVDRAPDDWRAWYRLGLAYEDAGDRRRARAALRYSIGLHEALPDGRPVPVTPKAPPLPPGGLEGQSDQRGRDSSNHDDDQEGRLEE